MKTFFFSAPFKCVKNLIGFFTFNVAMTRSRAQFSVRKKKRRIYWHFRSVEAQKRYTCIVFPFSLLKRTQFRAGVRSVHIVYFAPAIAFFCPSVLASLLITFRYIFSSPSILYFYCFANRNHIYHIKSSFSLSTFPHTHRRIAKRRKANEKKNRSFSLCQCVMRNWLDGAFEEVRERKQNRRQTSGN